MNHDAVNSDSGGKSAARIVEGRLIGSSADVDALLEALERAGFRIKRGGRKGSRHNARDVLQYLSVSLE
jgi:hypothetical protein